MLRARRVVGQLFLETLVLGSIAAIIGMAGSYGSLSWIKNSLEGWPYYITLSPNPRIVLFVVVLTLLVSAVTGLLPALRVTRHDLRNTLYGGRGFAFGGFGKVGALLLVVEIALSVALLNGAVTMARAFNVVLRRDPGAAEESDPDRAAWPHSIAGNSRSHRRGRARIAGCGGGRSRAAVAEAVSAAAADRRRADRRRAGA